MSPQTVDLAIIGAGLAGLAAAVHAASQGLRTTLVERDQVTGGYLQRLARVDAVPGFPPGLTGPELADRATAQAIRFGIDVIVRGAATRLQIARGEHRIEVDGVGLVSSAAVILATGFDSREVSIPGLRELAGSGIYFDAPESPLEVYAGCDAFVAGEAGPAARLALDLSGHCRRIVLLVEPGLLAAHLSPDLAARLRAADNVILRPSLEVAAVFGVEGLEALGLRHRRTGRVHVRTASVLFLLSGGRPRSAWLPASILRDVDDFVITGAAPRGAAAGRSPWPLDRSPRPLETSVPGVFAVGHLRSGECHGIRQAIGDGVSAARQAMEYIREQPQESRLGAERPGPDRSRSTALLTRLR